ncbi:adenylate kinase isoenzyme 5 [Aphidius gifuensis]|nr:adenylate kinase isoenzyme 5 [Aphidius gifuensis]
MSNAAQRNAYSIRKRKHISHLLKTSQPGEISLQTVSSIDFHIPEAAVIFILGGPGSGKVTHCDNLARSADGIQHINMTDILQRYSLNLGIQDFGLLSSKTVAEILMLEMETLLETTIFLVSGYPRSMTDVVEYSEKIQYMNGAVLVSWRQEVLERQIDYGAQLGKVIIELAHVELRNFYRNVMPVAEYFDQTGILLQVNGERHPGEVYADFQKAVFHLINFNKRTLSGTRALQTLKTEAFIDSTRTAGLLSSSMSSTNSMGNIRNITTSGQSEYQIGLPEFVWVIGGPGSNKSQLCVHTVRSLPNWMHISIGSLLRKLALSDVIIKKAVESGEMVAQEIVMQIIEQQVSLNRTCNGIIIDGFPRDLSQAEIFEHKFGQEPPLVLLDCSKLKLGREKLDDNIPAFRKRLQLFRKMTLPMLKVLDECGRLMTIDGDTDVSSVHHKFTTVIQKITSRNRQKK